MGDPMTRTVHRLATLLVLLAPHAWAQPVPGAPDPPRVEMPDATLDQAVLLAIYRFDEPVAAEIFRAMDRSAPAVFYGVTPAVAALALLSSEGGVDLSPAVRLGLTQAGIAGVVYGLKELTWRDRPYVAEWWVASRSARHPGAQPTSSFPSTHAALAAGIATSLSLSRPEWWVVVPLAAWAGTVGLSRPWLGVHYPSDVLAGVAIGAGSALLVHLAWQSIAGPQVGNGGEPEGPAVLLPLVRATW